MAESLGQKRLTARAERVTFVIFLEAGIRLLLDSSLEVRTNGQLQVVKHSMLNTTFIAWLRSSGRPNSINKLID